MPLNFNNRWRVQNLVPVNPLQFRPAPKFRRYQAWLALCFFAVVNLRLVGPVRAESRAVHTGDTAQTDYSKWMRWVPDSTPLSRLSIPGTHDTMAHYGGSLVRTQTMPLREQLKAGIRTIDIRARHVQDRFYIYHGIIYQNANFSDVLEACNDFLDQNPTETILLWMSADGVPDAVDNTRPYYATFQWYRDESGLGGRIATTVGSAEYDVPLGEVRGKIVIIQGFSSGFSSYGLAAGDIPGNGYWDLGDYSDMPEKWGAVLGHAITIEFGSSTVMYQNSLDGSSERGGIWPIDVANGILGEEGIAYRYLRLLFAGGFHRTTGLVYMDFPGSGLIAAIIAHNMKYATNLSAMASDFSKVVKDISYSTTSEGDDEAADRARGLKRFLEYILPQQHWSVLAGSDTWGMAFESEGLFGQSDSIDGYTHIALSSRRLDATVTSAEVQGYLTPTVLLPLSGDLFMRAANVKSMLKTRFPLTRWNVAVKRSPTDADHWAADLSAAAIASIPMVDDGAVYVYTAWATSVSNLPPVAATGGRYTVNEGSPVTFDASQSSDPTGDVLQYRWDLDGNGTWDTDYLYEPTITHTYTDGLATSPWLEVFDGSSSTVEKVSLKVRNVTPTVEVAGPIGLGSDRTLSRACTIVDPGSDSWLVEVSYGDGTPSVAPTLAGRTFTLNHQFPASGYFEVKVEMRDDDGDESTTRFHVVTGMPALGIQSLGSSTLELSWPNHAAPFRLETSVQAGAPWQPVPGSPVLVNGSRLLKVNSTNACALFRLALP